ncbi:MAG: hypothetical protein ABS68_00330 [Niastella sp. SCN 39-18]|nr:hypothetical protein [Sphingobacteriales bacterium]ODT55198.1 MAG: hypothetical protein ABS68_00330 [Niastella sp. SCN 39-18]OJW09090.1 MAG: hypothetical protein BGO53_00075 [Sphingobacteriales bacterium 39-19]
MKIIFSYILIFLSFCCLASEGDSLGRQVKHQFITDQWGHTKWGLYRIPPTEGVHPVIVFFHGAGEAGSTENDLNKLMAHGLPWLISTGNNLKFNNPVSGQPMEFISIAIQNPGWSTEPSDVFYVLQHDPIMAPRIKRNAIFFTGLSAGAGMILQAVTTSPEWAAQVAGIVPMSAAGAGNSSGYAYWTGKPTWAFHGLQDATCPYQYTETFINACGGKWTRLPSGHGNWNSLYDPQYKENINGQFLNIYEWMLSVIVEPVLSLPPVNSPGPQNELQINGTTIKFKANRLGDYAVFNILGQRVCAGRLKLGYNYIDVRSNGLFILKTELRTIKILL